MCLFYIVDFVGRVSVYEGGFCFNVNFSSKCKVNSASFTKLFISLVDVGFWTGYRIDFESKIGVQSTDMMTCEQNLVT